MRNVGEGIAARRRGETRLPDATDNRTLRERLALLEHDHRRLRAAHHALAERFESMTKAEEIAQAVTEAITEQRRARYTLTRKTVGAIAAAVLLVPAIHNAASWWFG